MKYYYNQSPPVTFIKSITPLPDNSFEIIMKIQSACCRTDITYIERDGKYFLDGVIEVGEGMTRSIEDAKRMYELEGRV